MRYIQSQMKKLVKDNKELQMRLRELMDEHELEKGFALKALYHSEVAEGGQLPQALDLPKDNSYFLKLYDDESWKARRLGYTC